MIVALSSAACAVAGSFVQLLAFRAAGGVGSTMFTVAAALAHLRLAPPSLRGRATGACGTAASSWARSPGRWPAGARRGQPARTVSSSTRRCSCRWHGGRGCRARGTGLAPHEPGPVRPAVTFGTLLAHRSFRAALLSNVLNGWTVYGVRVALVPLYVIGGAPAAEHLVRRRAHRVRRGNRRRTADRRAVVRPERPPPGRRGGSAVVAVTALWLGFATSHGGAGGRGAAVRRRHRADEPGGERLGRRPRHDGATATSRWPGLAGFQMVGDPAPSSARWWQEPSSSGAAMPQGSRRCR